MTISRACSRLLLALATLMMPAQALAQISGTTLNFPNAAFDRNGVAFDKVDGVYLVIVQRPPVVGRFLTKDGVQIGSDFNISLETPVGSASPYVAWPQVAFGGPANDPCFLVTYMLADLSTNPKYARIVRYHPGLPPTVSARSKVVDVNGEWIYSEKAQNVWDGQQFVVGTRMVPSGFSQSTPVVNHIDVNGNVSDPVILGDGLDYEGSPALSCAANGVCAAVGFQAGIPTGYSGGSYARLFDSVTLQPRGSLLALAAGNPNEDQGVVYQAHTGRFLTEWFRGGANVIDTRTIGTDGSMSALDLNKGIGQNAGANAISYNAATRTSLLITKLGDAVLTALELGDDGQPIRPSNTVVVTTWDGQVPDYHPAVVTNDSTGQWVVTASLAAGGIGKIIQGTLAAGVPPPTTVVAIVTDATLPSATAGSLYSAQLAATGGTGPYVWTKVGGALPSGMGLSGAVISGTSSSAGLSTFRLRVTGLDGSFAERDFSLTVGATTSPAPTPVPGARHGADIDGDGKADQVVFRASTGTWLILNSSTGAQTTVSFGQSGDVPVPGDYDGDGRTDLALYRPSINSWLIRTSSSNFTTTVTYGWGLAGDIPVAGDYDGDKKTDVAMYRPSNGTWYILTSSSGFTTSQAIAWGASGDIPVTGDFDGDGKTDPTVYRPSVGTWFVLKSSSRYASGVFVAWGTAEDAPMAGDYDGDGKTDFAVYRPSRGAWYILKSTTNFTTWLGLGLGQTGDVPITGDFDGDGKCDIAVFRPSTGAWLIAGSNVGYLLLSTTPLGTTGDVPVFR